jgi:hypothetical protein
MRRGRDALPRDPRLARPIKIARPKHALIVREECRRNVQRRIAQESVPTALRTYPEPAHFFFYLTAPKVNPRTSCFCVNHPSTMIGATARNDAAESLAQKRPSGLE